MKCYKLPVTSQWGDVAMRLIISNHEQNKLFLAWSGSSPTQILAVAYCVSGMHTCLKKFRIIRPKIVLKKNLAGSLRYRSIIRSVL